jgi:hypothetical protein
LSKTFLTYMFTHLSSFLLSSVSIDRAIATNFINFSKVYSKPKMAYKIILVNIAIASIINMHSLFFLGYYTNNSGRNETQLFDNTSFSSSDNLNMAGADSQEQFSCATKVGTAYDLFTDPYFRWIDLFAYAIIPFFTMAICTFLIIRVLFRSHRRLNKNKPAAKTNVSSSPLVSNKRNSPGGSETELETLRTSVVVAIPNSKDQPYQQTSSLSLSGNSSVAKKAPLKPAVNQRANKAKHLTYTLVTINCLFFCMVSPLVITLIVFEGNEGENTKILINFVYLLAYSNHS